MQADFSALGSCDRLHVVVHAVEPAEEIKPSGHDIQLDVNAAIP